MDLRSVEELRKWQYLGLDFVVVDNETGEGVTRVLLAALQSRDAIEHALKEIKLPKRPRFRVSVQREA